MQTTTFTNQANTEIVETQLSKLKYLKDIREVMSAKPKMEQAPKKAFGLALNLTNGDKFGTWQWIKEQPKADEIFVYFEPIEITP